MKVWVVSRKFKFDPGEIHSVWSTEEKAQATRHALIAVEPERPGDFYVVVEPFEVDTTQVIQCICNCDRCQDIRYK